MESIIDQIIMLAEEHAFNYSLEAYRETKPELEDLGFEYNDTFIVNPFIDVTARFDYSLAEARTTYGAENVDKYIVQLIQNQGVIEDIYKKN